MKAGFFIFLTFTGALYMVSAQGDAGLMNYLMMSNALGNDQLFGLLALTMGNRPAPQQTYSASNIPMGLQTSMQSSQMPTGKRGKGPQRTPTVPQSNPGYGSFGRASAGGSAGQGTSGMGGMQSMLPLLAYSGSDKMQRAFTCQMLSSGGSFNPLCLTGFAGLFGGA